MKKSNYKRKVAKFKTRSLKCLFQRENLHCISFLHKNIRSKINKIKKTYDGSSRWDIHLGEVLAVIPLKWRSKESSAGIDPLEAAEIFGVAVQHHSVGTSALYTDTVVYVALLWVEVEDEQQASPFEDDDLVGLVLQTDVCLFRMKPSILLLGMLHPGVELIQESVSEEFVFREIELTSCIPEAVIISFSWEVEPLWMAKLVTFKVQVAFAAQTVC